MNRSIVRWVFVSIMLLAFAAASFGQIAVGISVRIGPPPLPVYAQPICPGPGYIWTPGYWAWDDDDGYYWVPGTWVIAPVGMLWTPGWWGWSSGFYVWHAGYWGPHVGFYGGINYGFGYTGVGFWGGEWRGDRFYYNRSVTNVSVTNVTNVYNKTVIVNNTNVRNVSYNGGNGGVNMRPTPQQEAYARERHQAPMPMQMQHQQAAMRDKQNLASYNHGRPAVAATMRPADFSSRSVVSARAAGGEYHPPAMSPREARANGGSGARPNTNQGFRPFSPPNRSGNPNANANPRNNADNQGRFNGRPQPNQGRFNDRPQQSQPRFNDRPQQSQPRVNDRPQQSQPRMNDRGPQSQPRPQVESRPAPQPRMNPRPNPAPARQGPPPKEEHHRGR
jgi:WXXGXW repeat (2 copies)